MSKRRYKSNESYWRKRVFDLTNKRYDEADRVLEGINSVYEAAMQKYDEKIYRQLEKFAQAGGTTVDQALKELNRRQLAGYKMDLQDYIKLGEAGNWSKDVMEAMEKASSQYHITHYQAMQTHLEAISADIWARNAKSMTGFLGDQYKKSYYHLVKDLQTFKGKYESVSGIDDGLLGRILNEPWAPDGRPFSERIWNNQAKLISNLKKELALHVSGVQGLDAASENIAHAMGVSYKNASRLVYGEMSYLLNDAHLEAIKKSGANYYEYVATLDSRTSSFCRSLDGKIFKVEDFRRGVTAPPHPGGGCRSTIIAHFDDGIDTSPQRAARIDGKTVQVENLNYEKWYKKYVIALGEKGYKIDKRKLTEYALNMHKDKNKATAFKKALGYDVSNYEELIDNIYFHLDPDGFEEKGDKGYGMTYSQNVVLKGANGKTAEVLTAWIEEGLKKRLISLYVTKRTVK